MTRVAIGALTYEGTCVDLANARYETERIRRAIGDHVPERDLDAAVHVALTLLDRDVLALPEAGHATLAVAEDADVDDPREAAVEQVAAFDLEPVEGADEMSVRQGMLRLHAVLVGVFEAATGDAGPTE